jgi:hypothetical protein
MAQAGGVVLVPGGLRRDLSRTEGQCQPGVGAPCTGLRSPLAELSRGDLVAPREGSVDAAASAWLLNLRLGVVHGGLDVSAFVNNVTNSDPILGLTHASVTDSLYSATAIRPRTMGVTGLYRF